MSQKVHPSSYVNPSPSPLLTPNILKRKASGPLEGEPDEKRLRTDETSGPPVLTLTKHPSPPHLRFELRLSLSESQASLEPLSLRKSKEIFAEFSQSSLKSSKEIPKPLDIRFYSASKIGIRPSNEDAELFCPIEGIGALAIVCDGHGDQGKISGKTAEILKNTFPTLIRKNRSGAEQIMKDLCERIHKAVNLPMGGTTALICFFDTERKKLTVGTLGDSRAILFRKNGDKIEYEWLSKEMNWATPEGEESAKRAFQNEKIFNEWRKLPPKDRYFPHYPLHENKVKQTLRPQGVNVSHSIGDKCWTFQGREAISHIPDTKTIDLEEDVFILSGCDGLWDFVNIQAFIEAVIRPHWEHKHMPEKIVEYALKTSTDNVSVICAWVKKMGAPVFHNTQESQETQPLLIM